MKPLFSGVAHDWYVHRLKQQYKKRPSCGLLHTVNHLLGSCPVCGQSSIKKFQTVQIPIERVYTVLSTFDDPITRIQNLAERYGFVLTNVEYPLPMLRFQTLTHLPAFFVPSQNLVVDFFPSKSIRTTRFLRLAEKAFTTAGMRYQAFAGESEIFRSSNMLQQEAVARQLSDLLNKVMVI